MFEFPFLKISLSFRNILHLKLECLHSCQDKKTYACYLLAAMDGIENMDIDALFTSDTEKTFQYEDELPSLSVPTLEHTLERYLDSGMEFEKV